MHLISHVHRLYWRFHPQITGCVQGLSSILSEMGKSAKIHKRTVRPPQNHPIAPNKECCCSHVSFPLLPQSQKKKTSSDGGASTTLTTPTTTKPAQQAAIASAAKKTKLKGKRGKLAARSSSSGGVGGGGGPLGVLGGADYVDIMMGSRRREREEALKLPRDET
jgi:hypothetical protein